MQLHHAPVKPILVKAQPEKQAAYNRAKAAIGALTAQQHRALADVTAHMCRDILKWPGVYQTAGGNWNPGVREIMLGIEEVRYKLYFDPRNVTLLDELHWLETQHMGYVIRERLD